MALFGTGPMSRREFTLSLAAVLAAPRMLGAQAAQAAPSLPVIKAMALNHVAILATDVKRSVEWYQRVFGMAVQYRQDLPGGQVALLRVGPGPNFLAVHPANGAKAGFSHMCFGVQNLDRSTADKTLAAHNLKGEWRTRKAQGGDVEELFVRDQDGLLLQVQDSRYCGGGGKLGDVCSQAWTMPPKADQPPLVPRSVNHVSFGVSNRERAGDFYQAVFGLPMLSWDFRPAEPGRILGLTPGFPRQFIAPFKARNIGIDHCCLGIEGFDFDKVAKTLTDLGIKLPPAPTQTGRPGCCGSNVTINPKETIQPGQVRDPDGVPIQLTDARFCAGGGNVGEVCAYSVS